MTYDAILFDFDGVLADSEPVHFACWKEILAPYGIAFEWETFARECVGVADREMLLRLSKTVTPAISFEALVAEYPRKKTMFREKMLAAPPFMEETIAMVREVVEQFPLAVVSSSGREEIEPPITAVGIRECFQTLVCGLEAGKLKPAPDPYFLAAERLKARCPLVVEDSDAGERSARSAGFDVVRVKLAVEVPEAVRRAIWR